MRIFRPLRGALNVSQTQLFIKAYGKALEVIPRQLCNNAGFDATDVLNKLRQKHALSDGSGKVGVGMASSCVWPYLMLVAQEGGGGRQIQFRFVAILSVFLWNP